MNSSERVGDMYVKKDTLSTRVNLHDKYSVNRYGWRNWVFDQYAFPKDAGVLEAGCGTGVLWAENLAAFRKARISFLPTSQG